MSRSRDFMFNKDELILKATVLYTKSTCRLGLSVRIIIIVEETGEDDFDILVGIGTRVRTETGISSNS